MIRARQLLAAVPRPISTTPQGESLNARQFSSSSFLLYSPNKNVGFFFFCVRHLRSNSSTRQHTHTQVRYRPPSLPAPCIYIHISKAVLFTHRKVHQRATAPTPQESIKTMEGGNEFFFSFLWGGSLFFVCREIVCGWGRERKGQKV